MKTVTNLFILLFCLAITNGAFAQRVKGEGPIVSKDLKLDRFESIKLGISGDVYIKQGNTQSVRVEGQENLIEVLNTDVNDGTWRIKFDARNVYMKTKFKVYITMPTIEAAIVSGSGSIVMKNHFSNLDDLEVGVSGSGDVYVDADCRIFTAFVSGSGDITAKGSAQSANVSVSGSGDYSGYDMRMQNCEARVTGSGDIEVHADETLVASVTGSGDIDYKGNPRVKARVTGSGDIDAH